MDLWTGIGYTSRRQKASILERDVEWVDYTLSAYDGIINTSLVTPPPHKNVITYAVCDFKSDTARRIQLNIRANDAIMIWINDRLILENNRSLSKTISVDLEEGNNRLLIKSGIASASNGFSIRSTDMNGNVLILKSQFSTAGEE